MKGVSVCVEGDGGREERVNVWRDRLDWIAHDLGRHAIFVTRRRTRDDRRPARLRRHTSSADPAIRKSLYPPVMLRLHTVLKSFFTHISIC